MIIDGKLYDAQQPQHRNGSDSKIQHQQKRWTFHHRRSNKFLILLIFLAIHAVYNVKDESRVRILSSQNGDDGNNHNVNPAWNGEINYRTGNGEINDRTGNGEINFRLGSPTTHISQASIIISGVTPRPPNGLEIMHFESTLFFGLNEAMNSANINVQVKDVRILSTFKLIDDEKDSNSNTIEAERGFDDEEMEGDDVTEDDDDGMGGHDDGMEEYDDTNWAYGGDRKRRDTQNDITTLKQKQKQKPKHILRVVQAHETLPFSKYKIQLGVRITSTQYISSSTPKIERLLLEAINQNVEILREHLQDGKELDTEQKVALNYFQNMEEIFCTKVIDVRPDVEDRSAATALPPRPPTAAPTSEGSIPVRSNVQMRAPTQSPAGDKTHKPRDKTHKPKPELQSILMVSPRAEQLRNVSACVFVVTLIIIGFWNMVRLNRCQVERRRNKVQLAKVAYQAPLSMASGLMDMGVSDSIGSIPPVATAKIYDNSTLDDDRYIGTMDKTAPSL